MDAVTVSCRMIRQTTTLRDFLDSVYVPSHLGIAPATVHQLSIAVRLLDRWADRSVIVAELSDDLLLQFLSHLLKDRAPATVNAKRRFLLAIWRYAHKKGYTDTAPRDVPRVPEYHRLPEAWTVTEVEQIFVEARRVAGEVAGIPKRYWWPSLLFAVYDSGGRIGAIRQVRPSDVSLPDRYIILRAETQKDRRPKYCPLTDQAVAAMAAIFSDHRALMWPWPFSREWLESSFKTILRRADVSFGREHGGLFHKLRRTSGSLIEASGGDGSRHLGNTRAVFEKHYHDPRISGDGQLDRLPRLNIPDDDRQLRLF